LVVAISCLFDFFFNCKIKDPVARAGGSVGAGIGLVSLGLATIGIGFIFAGFMLALSRAPEMLNSLFQYTILGFALCEALALFSLVFSLFILFF
jgi:F-type H+-transporting ATPase subunit c